MHFNFTILYRYVGITVFTWVLSWLVAGCVKEDFSGCPTGAYSIAFEYVNHTDAEHTNRFCRDVHRVDLYVFDSTGHFVKCITTNGAPFDKDFHIEPELPEGGYTLVAWGNISDEVLIKPVFVSGKTTFEEGILSLKAIENQSVNKKLTSVFHAIKEVTVEGAIDKTDILSFTKNENQLNLTVKWFDKSGASCIHRCAEGVRARVVDPKGATYKFDNSVVASGNEMTYYPYQINGNKAGNQLESVFSLMRLVEGEKLTLLIERLMPDGNIKEIHRTDLIELIKMHPYASIQSELERQDVYNIEISLIDDLDGDTDTYMQTAIIIAGWKIILQDTGI
ncbi:FimB/Mfa2 family fimbrial subunit [uncultured Bacteroides sp.]|uniref:FimB/Mfa2 family fimbrial subunit n=1 Tax=uncultured Bacteroides sp. TaxID=162156 RepID=UPI0025ECF91C|nr:FimB/Mfa2 family fimbrial subunit [uncultured Bacteroides sp.]